MKKKNKPARMRKKVQKKEKSFTDILGFSISIYKNNFFFFLPVLLLLMLIPIVQTSLLFLLSYAGIPAEINIFIGTFVILLFALISVTFILALVKPISSLEQEKKEKIGYFSAWKTAIHSLLLYLVSFIISFTLVLILGAVNELLASLGFLVFMALFFVISFFAIEHILSGASFFSSLKSAFGIIKKHISKTLLFSSGMFLILLLFMFLSSLSFFFPELQPYELPLNLFSFLFTNLFATPFLIISFVLFWKELRAS
ncbi:hypothetical protein KAW38_04790 [Candidatus Micrarchaeota archaeon]|nr:hypothetical protein [Candidatus Micrarchaeota archaeon]